jgi:hypothetical protein
MSNYLKSNERMSVRRSNTTGVIPTIPTESDFTLWLDTDIFDGEFFLNTADAKLWLRSDSAITEIIYDTDLAAFTSLTDTPSGYQDGYLLMSTGSAITYTEYPDIFTNITDMDDFIGGDYTGYNGYSIVVDEANSGFTYQLIEPQAFTDLTDTPASLSADTFLKVDASGSTVELVNGYDYFVDLISNQTIGGAKTFIDDVILDKITVNTIQMTGAIISEIKTDLNTSDDDSLPTTKAVTDFVYDTITGTFSGAFVTIDNNEEINSKKTFTEDQTFEKDIVVYNEVYLGDKNTDGSYKIRKDMSGDLLIEKRIGSAWVSLLIL